MSLEISLNESNSKRPPKADKNENYITSPVRKQLRKILFSLPQDDNSSSNSENLTFHSDESSDPELGNTV